MMAWHHVGACDCPVGCCDCGDIKETSTRQYLANESIQNRTKCTACKTKLKKHELGGGTPICDNCNFELAEFCKELEP